MLIAVVGPGPSVPEMGVLTTVPEMGVLVLTVVSIRTSPRTSPLCRGVGPTSPTDPRGFLPERDTLARWETSPTGEQRGMLVAALRARDGVSGRPFRSQSTTVPLPSGNCPATSAP